MAFEPRWFRVAFLARDWSSTVCCANQSLHLKPGRIGSSKLWSFIIFRKESSTQRLDQKRLSFCTSFGATSSSVAAWRIMWKESLVSRVRRVFDRKRLPVLARYCPWSRAIKPSYNFWASLSTLSFCWAANPAMPQNPMSQGWPQQKLDLEEKLHPTTSYTCATLTNPSKNCPTLLENSCICVSK